MDFDKLLITHREAVGTKMDLNAQLKFWTNQFILRDTPKATLKILCLSILFLSRTYSQILQYPVFFREPGNYPLSELKFV